MKFNGFHRLHNESCIVMRGVVCKKNVAHRRMTSRIEKPRFLLLGGALEYQHEMDHLKMVVAKIDAHQPDVLLVEKSVSQYAQEFSLFQEEHGIAGQAGKKMVKTLMYFEGCPKPFGCTILLRGANGDELKKVKHVVQYGVFVAYHLALETSFLADEGTSLPELPLNAAALTVALPDKPSNIERSISTIPGFTFFKVESGIFLVADTVTTGFDCEMSTSGDTFSITTSSTSPEPSLSLTSFTAPELLLNPPKEENLYTWISVYHSTVRHRAKSVAVLELIYPPKEALSVVPCRSCPELYKSRVLELNAYILLHHNVNFTASQFKFYRITI
ncbi:1-phosphatidylinositol-3-phosphate 5-kinase FAB1B-like protein [Tanacetum coccineum]